MSERQKLIKLADRSECGWATVSAYVTDDLADTPEDERRICKAEKSAKKALDSKREKSRVKSGSANYKSNHASFSHVSNSRLGADDAVKSFRPQPRPFSFDKPHFCPDLSSGEEPASLVDWKGTGETTALISFLQEDQISQPSDVFDFEKCRLILDLSYLNRFIWKQSVLFEDICTV